MAESFECSRCGIDTPNKKDIFGIDGEYLFTSHICDACNKRMDLEYEFQSEGEVILEPDLVCPWCQTSYESYDAYAFEGGDTEVECMFCGKHFDIEIETRRRYSTKRSLCEIPDDYGKESTDG